MTQYDARQATGDDGELEVERFVRRVLGYIYRPVTKNDHGIDGEIEILSRGGRTLHGPPRAESRRSTGGLIKVQVKSTREPVTGSTIRVPLDEAHLDYFASLTVPVILVYVSLANDRLWWRPIHNKRLHKGPRGGFAVTLDVETDRLTRSSASLLSFIGDYSNAAIAKDLIETVAGGLDQIDDRREADDIDDEAWVAEIADMEKDLVEAACLLKYEWRYTDRVVAIVEALDEARGRLRDLKDWVSIAGWGDVLDERLRRDWLDD